MTTIIIDWADVTDPDALYDSVFDQTGAPSWHGRNLGALNDSWVTGAICTEGPPFDFVLKHEGDATGELGLIAAAVRGIAEDSVRVNGGTVST